MAKKKWTEEVEGVDRYGDGNVGTDVVRSVLVKGTLEKNGPLLLEALAEMCDGLDFITVEESYFTLHKNSPRQKPKLEAEVHVVGVRPPTKEEEMNFLEKEKLIQSENEERYLRTLRRINREAPHVFRLFREELDE